ncbi:MAG: YheU family protein [Desulfobacterales bacterium]|nr:YheU family protein [Desulfobacterales bacterium]
MENGCSVVKVPYEEIDPETLDKLIEDFVARTSDDDTSDDKVLLENKMNQVKKHLQKGKAIILFDEISQSCNIFSKDNPVLRFLKL